MANRKKILSNVLQKQCFCMTKTAIFRHTKPLFLSQNCHVTFQALPNLVQIFFFLKSFVWLELLWYHAHWSSSNVFFAGMVLIKHPWSYGFVCGSSIGNKGSAHPRSGLSMLSIVNQGVKKIYPIDVTITCSCQTAHQGAELLRKSGSTAYL